jgi:peroxiredoxin
MKPIHFLIFALVFLIGCSNQDPTQLNNGKVTEMKKDLLDEKTAAHNVNPAPWMDTVLKDVKTGSNFKISDFKGKNILLESFAVWCPTCTKQQKELQKLHGIPGIEIIELDTDPNEDEAKVLEHINKNDFQGLYAVAPKSLSDALVEEFGLGVVSAPSAPVILICKEGSTRFLKRGVKSAESLKEEITKGC